MRRMSSRSPDILICVAALLGSIVAYLYLHGNWYGGWMGRFGDPPSMNPAYLSVRELFLQAPFASAGLTGGLIAGISYYTDWQGVAMRLGTLGLTCLILDGGSPHFGFSVFIPVAMLAFATSSVISWFYGMLLLKALERSRPQRPE
jgi:hypothetical protein